MNIKRFLLGLAFLISVGICDVSASTMYLVEWDDFSFDAPSAGDLLILNEGESVRITFSGLDSIAMDEAEGGNLQIWISFARLSILPLHPDPFSIGEALSFSFHEDSFSDSAFATGTYLNENHESLVGVMLYNMNTFQRQKFIAWGDGQGAIEISAVSGSFGISDIQVVTHNGLTELRGVLIIPEPEVSFLLLSGLLPLCARRRRRSQV